MQFQRFITDIFHIQNETQFDRLALQLFYYQAEKVDVYRRFIAALGVTAKRIKRVKDIPFMPVEFFRDHAVHDQPENPALCFESSATTQTQRSRHFVHAPGLYEKSFLEGFTRQYGAPENWAILGLLPSYLDRPNASLLYMTAELIRRSPFQQSGFYPTADEHFIGAVHAAQQAKIPTLVLGVSFALLDWAEAYPMPLNGITLMETGGMKGRREEWIRDALHQKLMRAFGLSAIHSEYGMTEMLSQCYAKEKGWFKAPPWVKIQIRDPKDPFDLVPTGTLGGVNIIDLANLHSCAFIAVQDVGRMREDGKFSIEGRFDEADVRGCNLMAPPRSE